MKVLFVNPPNTTSFHAAEPAKYVEENIGAKYFVVPRIPFQVMTGINVPDKDIILLDYEWYKNPRLTKEQLIDKALDAKPDVVLTTLISTSNADSLDYLTTKIKEMSPQTKIVLGGQGVETLKGKTFKFIPNIDAAVLTSSGRVLNSVLEKLASGEFIHTLVQQKDEEEIHAPESMYSPFKQLLEDIVNVVKSRGATPIGLLENYKGCPFACEFCAAKKPVKRKNVNTTLEEIDYLYKTGIPRFYFLDLTFGLNKKDTIGLLERLQKFKLEHLDFGFRCVTRANIIDKRLAQQMKDAGCYEVGIGVETGDDSVLKIMNKKSSQEINWQAMDALNNVGITFKLFLIEGHKGSSSNTSAETFRLLNQIDAQGYSYFVQPALSRDIMPHQEGFRAKEKKGVLQRGTMHQLDFRHDGRDFGWDQDRSVRAMCYLMLAYPSTEISQTRSDLELQKRAVMDMPFLVSRSMFREALALAKNDVQKDVAHYLDGIYTQNEINQHIERIYKSAVKHDVLDFIERARARGLIDSFGQSNPLARVVQRTSEEKSTLPQTSKDVMLFWNGKDRRYLYFPIGVKNMKASFYEDIPEDVFEFLSLAKGFYSIKEISTKMYEFFMGKEGYETQEESKRTVKAIEAILQKERILVS